MRIESFEPIEDIDSQILIVGTMPGVESLQKGEYYAHPKNHFWDIIFRVFKKDFDFFQPVQETISYPEKIDILKKNKIALWDVLKFCDRKGSLDKEIRNEIKNNFDQFFLEHLEIRKIIFNGKNAHKYFKESYGHILNDTIESYILNSTSSSNTTNVFNVLNEWKNKLF
jgi:hypoxanthine-DNA glycosylase